MNECVHGMNPDWCGICKEPRGSVYSGHGVSTAGGRTKQDEFNLLCDQLRLPREPIGEGSSLPSEVFEQIQIRFGLPRGSMPEVAQSAAEAAGLPWSPEFDSRSSLSGGGSTGVGAAALLIPMVGSAVLLLIGGALMGAGYGSTVADSAQTGRLALAALAYWPAVMVFVGIAVALFGWLPRLAIPLAWGVLAAMWFVVIIGDALHLPHWLLDVLPFSATPYQPLEQMSWTPLVVMTLLAAALVWAGLDRFARRDVQPG